MMDEESIFAAALQQPSESARAAFLENACQGNDQLRRSVAELLRAHDEATDFLATPIFAPDAAAPSIPPWNPELPTDARERGIEVTKPRSPISTTGGDDGTEVVRLDFLEKPRKPGLLGHLGPYDVTGMVGQGGMGIVLKGLDPKLSRTVAIKVLAPELARNVMARKRFLREAQAAASVSHHHVVTTHAIDQVGDHPFIVMEYIAGESLQERIDRDGPLEVLQIVNIARQTAMALAAAHEQGLIHRDIKPANILLENGIQRVKLGDFGLARAIDDVSTTQTGLVAGTPQYMSPEQAQGNRVDHRSDLFSLGCVIYSMCTGRSPFRDDSTVAVLRRVCDEDPRPIDQVNQDVPDWLIAIVGCLLEKDPENRFQSAQEVAAILGMCLAHYQEPGRQPIPDVVRSLIVQNAAKEAARSDRSAKIGRSRTPTRRFPQLGREPIRRRLRIAVAGLAAMIITLGMLAGTGISDVGEYLATVLRISTPHGVLVVEVDDPAVEILIDDENLIITGAGPKEVRLKPGRYNLRTRKEGRLISQELVSIERGGKQVVTIALEPQENAPQSQPSETLEDRAAGPKQLARIVGRSGVRYAVRFSRDGKSILTFTRGDGFARAYKVSDASEYQDFPGQFGAGSWTPDGEHVVLGTHHSDGAQSNSISLWEISTGQQVRKLPAITGAVQALDISADGKLVVSAHGQWWGEYQERDQSIRIWDLEKGEVLHTLTGHADQVTSVEFSGDGRTVISGSRDGTVRLWNAESGKEVRRFEGTGTEVFCIAISPDGRSVLAGFGPDSESGIHGRIIDDPEHCVAILWDIEGGQEIRRLEGHRGCINDVGFSPDGRTLVTASGGAYTGTPLPDGSSKKTHDNTARLWDAATGHELAVIRHQTSLASARFSPYGGILATGEFQLVHLWRIPKDLDTMASPAASTRSSALLISSNRDGKFDLFLLDPFREQAGTKTLFAPASDDGWRNLTRNNSEDSGPAWSPDGEWIAFCSSRSGNLDIWLMDANGGQLRQLTDHPGIDRTPCWSPHGDKIGFVRHLSADNWEIFVMEVDGSNQVNLTSRPGKQADPAWSPDGRAIAYSFDADGTQLYIMDSDGSNSRLLSARKGSFTYPSWSPDGSQLVYTGWKDQVGGDLELFVINADGTSERQLTAIGGLNTFAAWSPDGEWIAFEGRLPNTPGTYATVYLVRTDGTEVRPITQAEAHLGFGGGRPAWRPSDHGN
jgi:eukaryotic-like serine/threonine-protein kinase